MRNNINSFVNTIITQKKLFFSEEEVKIDTILFEKNILKSENNEISIVDYQVISLHFLEKYRSILKFEINKNFIENIDFIKRVKEDFTNGSYIQDYYKLEKEIWKTVIKEANSKYKCSFNEYLNSIDLENKPNDIYKFTDAYSKVLPELNIESNIIFDNLLILLEITKSDADYNINSENVLRGLKNKCKIDYISGLELLQKSLELNEDKDNIVSAIISGLYENKKEEFYNSVLKDLIHKGDKINPIFFGLSNITEINDKDCQLFVRLVNKYKRNDLMLSVLSLVFAILKSDNIKYHNFCFKELQSAIETEKTGHYILENLCFLRNYNQEKINIIIKLIKQKYFSINSYIQLINHIFLDIKEFSLFKSVVLNLIENRPFEDFTQHFNSYLHSVDKNKLDEFIIDLLTDNQASKRHIGVNIFNQLSNHCPYKFTFNILALPYILQYKLWVSLTQDFHKPKNRIVALLPLIDSKSDLIKESFICKLEELSEDYGSHITDIMKDNLNDKNKYYISVIERVDNYRENFYATNVRLKNSILELDPYNTHYKYIKKLNELFSKNMRKNIDKGVDKNSLLSVLCPNTIRLAKGGGWKIGGKNEISQLGKFETSLILPRSYFINPTKFDIEMRIMSKKDWTDTDFSEIKTLLENE